MSAERLINVGNAIFSDIDKNEYLNELYESILYNYSLLKFNLIGERTQRHINVLDALRFADLLSKSTDPEKKDSHKMWAQEIIVLLHELDPQNSDVIYYAGSVFSNTTNYQGKKQLNSEYSGSNLLERYFTHYQDDYLTIPAAPELRFLSAQKYAYDHLSETGFSYSGPTSFGKSFIMRMYIKEMIQNGASDNYALIVPTKALINEIYDQIIQKDLKDLLTEKNYKVVTSAGDIALEGQHNFVLVLTPERLLYLLISKPEIEINHIFIDEAHKLSGKNGRAPFYYKCVDMLLKRNPKPKFTFASPNIPNPEVYLKLLKAAEKATDDEKLRTTFSPVSQVKFFVDINNKEISVYNDHREESVFISSIGDDCSSFVEYLDTFEKYNRELPFDQRQQNIVYCNGKNRAIEYARQYYDKVHHDIDDPELIALSNSIKAEVHGDYYLGDLIKRGIAYHIGYLPASIRMEIEKKFKAGKITTMFCTSTLLEGVNLPADNLFIVDTKIFRKTMSAVDFRNLIGRVGRIEFNLHGNVFFFSDRKDNQKEEYERLLKKEIPQQSLSVETSPNNLTKSEKQYIVDKLVAGDIEITKRVKNQTEESYEMMRKFALTLLRDIMQDNYSLVRYEFRDFLDPEKEELIRHNFTDAVVEPDDDINTSVDQTKRLRTAISNGLSYPERVNGHFVYDDVLAFLEKLSRVFKWNVYETSTLGKSRDGYHTLLKWYAVILIQWMEGYGLSYIMQAALEYKEKNPRNFFVDGQYITYEGTTRHKNIVFADTLETIDNIILFSISNYFLRFSNEYKRVHGIQDFDNNWYEYVEYGTVNPLTIWLQRNGFTREVATYIRANRTDYLNIDSEGNWTISRKLLHCSNEKAKNEAINVLYNMQEIFEPEN